MSIREGKILVLDQPVTNPHPDGRKRNWTGEKQFPAGRYVIEASGLVYRCGHSRYDYVGGYGSNKDGAEVICEAATIVEPKGIKELLATMDGRDSAEQILGVLLHTNVIAACQIRSALEQLDADEDLYDRI
jgi:hypothetical protein